MLKRVYNIDALACECGGRLRFVELIEDKAAAAKALGEAGYFTEAVVPKAIAPSDDTYFYDEAPQDDIAQTAIADADAEEPPSDEALFHDPIPDDW